MPDLGLVVFESREIVQKPNSMLTEIAKAPVRALGSLFSVFGHSSTELTANDSTSNFTALLRSIEQGHRSVASTQPSGWQRMRVERIELESDTVKSFYLVGTGSRPLPDFLPGQHIIVSNADHQGPTPQSKSKPITRCYTLSSTANPRYWRISVKRQQIPADSQTDSLSNYLHDCIEVGDFLNVKGPRGDFTLKKAELDPVLLFGAGIGITPVVAMATYLAAADDRRPVWVFYQTHCPEQAALANELIELAKQCHNIQLNVAFSQLGSVARTNQGGNIHLFGGRITADPLADMAPHADIGHCFLCGPAEWMQSTIQALETRGFSKDRIHYESFGSVMVTASELDQQNVESISGSSNIFSVACKDSKLSMNFDSQQGSLLDQLQKAGVTVAGGCRVGNCGTCMTKLLKGQINRGKSSYPDLPEGWILPCVASPTSEIELEA